jgi:predicted metal-dependent enzyme (double-stranded beta helix superfamily)
MRLLLALERVLSGDTLWVVNDRDPTEVFQQLRPLIEKRFSYWNCEAGPDIWRTFVSCEEPIPGTPPNEEEALQMAINPPNRESSLRTFAHEVHSLWGDGTDPALPFEVKGLMETLISHASPQESWIAKLIREGRPAAELYRDKAHGFMLMSHVLPKGHNNAPHDHGPCWVIYGVYHGVAEITTYRQSDPGGASRVALERAESNRLTPDGVIVSPPGEIHSVFVPEPSVILRFLSSDLDRVERRYYICDGVGFRIETRFDEGRAAC